MAVFIAALCRLSSPCSFQRNRVQISSGMRCNFQTDSTAVFKRIFQNNIQQDLWCPFCSGRGKTIVDMQILAKNKHGLCISKIFKGVDEKLKWKCKHGHSWWQKPAHVLSGHWCPYCSCNAKLTLRIIKDTALIRDGKCLSKKYSNALSPLLWQCKYRHTWRANANNIRQGKWCPICACNLREKICRTIFEKLFHSKFPKAKPKWLLNAYGNRMELDGFNGLLNIAFEHQGEQHYKYNTYFHRNRTLSRQIKDDRLKRILCKREHISLIQIPYSISVENLPQYIQDKCKILNLPIRDTRINIESLSLDIYSANTVKDLDNYAKLKGGRLLSKEYLGAHIKHKWKCKFGHEWESTPSSIKNGQWCPHCAGTLKKSVGDAVAMAKRNKGKCLSKFYKNARSNLIWQCKNGHIWRASYDNVMKGTWCKICSLQKMAENNRIGIKKMKAIAAKQGGRCLSNIYINNKSKLLWKCSQKHSWEAIPSNIMQGKWCPDCARIRKHEYNS